MEILVELVVQLVLEVFGEILLEFGLEAFKGAFGRQNRSPRVATLGYLCLGAAIGVLSLWLLPERMLRPGPIPGLSVVIVPLIGGVVMHLWGSFRRSRGHSTTNLATFYGGAALLLSYCLVRVLWAR